MTEQHIEIERKWLIARPDEATLAALPGASHSAIVQTYLVAAAGETRRVRARTTDGVTTYTRTVKRRIDACSSFEDEAILAADEYAALLSEADPACRPVEKVRWCIPHGEHLCEVDLYPFWPRQAVLEIELAHADAPLTLPDWVRPIAEVTGQRAYSNHALARAIPKEHDV